MQELKQLADDIRTELSILSKTNKSFRPSLSAVELTVAIHHVFNAPVDKIAWDIEDQVKIQFLLMYSCININSSRIYCVISVYRVTSFTLLCYWLQQTYPHQLLTGRRTRLSKLGQANNLSSYACRNEYDPFGTGHGCSSISSGLGNPIEVAFISFAFLDI